MEISESLLPDILNGTLIMKADAESEVVMCSDSKTFALKKVETTNLQLLIRDTALPAAGDQMDISDQNHEPNLMSPPGLQTQLVKLGSSKTPPLIVEATNGEHIEVVEITPKLGIVERLLSSSPPYDGNDEEEEEAVASSLYTLSALEMKIHASRNEILEELSALNAVDFNGHYRLIAPSYLTEVLALITFTCREKGWDPLTSIPSKSLALILAKDSYRPEIVMHCLRMFGSKSPSDPMVMGEAEGGGGGEDGVEGERWALDEAKVCLHYARIILEKDPNQMPLLTDFMEAWTLAVRDHGFEPRSEWLTSHGEALLVGKGATVQVKHFPVCRLQKDPARRFLQLFEQKSKWTQEELQPYIHDLRVPGCASGALLLKFARASQATPSDPILYSAR